LTDFYDSARPGLIPAGARACLYYDGEFTPTPAEVKRLGPVRWITVLGGTAAAKSAGCADFEAGNAVFSVPGRLREWAQERLAMKCRARAYFSFSNAKAVHNQLAGMNNVVYWVATLDGVRLTPAQVVTRLAGFGVVVGEEKLWGHQFQGGPDAPYDVSELYGAW
jgi:hypothetical protein